MGRPKQIQHNEFLHIVNYLDLPIALVSLWVPPAPGIVPECQL